MTAAVLGTALLLAAQAAPAEVRFVTLAKGGSSGLRQPMRTVVRTAAQWAALWKEHGGTVEPPPPRPPVDFRRDAVIVVALGPRPTAGWGVEITRIDRLPTETVVHVRQRRPAPDALTAQVLTQPYHFVRVPRPRGAVRFVDEPETAPTTPVR
ncbi:MAG TPA: protease complex subunit PrcB family protein [Vicinamibacteria bacterium]|jgi:hypothetical protein